MKNKIWMQIKSHELGSKEEQIIKVLTAWTQ